VIEEPEVSGATGYATLAALSLLALSDSGPESVALRV
jgi:hypothetical protein